MEELPRIKTPWKQQWRRLRYQALPVFVMACCMVAIAWLWTRHNGAATGVGEVTSPQVNAYAQRDGALAEVPAQLFDQVNKGDVIARLDARPAERILQRAKAEATRLREDAPATRPTETRAATESSRLAVEVESLRMEMFPHLVEIELGRIAQSHSTPAPANSHGEAAGDDDDQSAEEQPAAPAADALSSALAAHRKAVAELTQKLDAARAKLKKLPSPDKDVEASLPPLRTTLAALELRLADARGQIDTMVIRSPIKGRVTAIHHQPGHNLRSGDAVVTLVNDVGQQIIAYVRQDQRVNPMPSMRVLVRQRQSGALIGKSVVQRVGPRVENIPSHQLRDPKIAEWGLPVIITMPQNLVLRPGELVDVRFNVD